MSFACEVPRLIKEIYTSLGTTIMSFALPVSHPPIIFTKI